MSTAGDPPLSFVMTDGEHTVCSRGITTAFGTAEQASQALRAQETALIVGALPFHAVDAPALFAPRNHWFTHGRPASFAADSRPFPQVETVVASPEKLDHGRRVEDATRRIARGEFHKVVLSRQERYTLSSAPSPEELLDRFSAGSSTGHCHLVDLSAAGPRYADHFFIGSSPELLISKRGSYIRSHPLAGTAFRSPDPVVDQARATELSMSAKDIAEHKFVTAEIKRILAPLCSSLTVPEMPALTSTSHTWHLGTVIEGTLKDPSTTALELAHLLHPTPAVSGYPQRETQRLLREEEPERGFYAGAFGWADAAGNGEWRVGIRSAQLHGNVVTARAGGGIVHDSDPHTEVEETCAKLGPIRTALGLSNVSLNQ